MLKEYSIPNELMFKVFCVMPIASKDFGQHEISLMNAVIIERTILNIQSVLHMILVF
jgi:hypothetical protein